MPEHQSLETLSSWVHLNLLAAMQVPTSRCRCRTMQTELASRKANGGFCGMIFDTKMKGPVDSPNPQSLPEQRYSKSRTQCAFFALGTYNPVTITNPASPNRSKRKRKPSNTAGSRASPSLFLCSARISGK